MSTKPDAATRIATAIAALRTFVAGLVSGGELDKAKAEATKAQKELEEAVTAIETFASEIIPPPPPVQKN